jgi:hypothetical protein
MELVEERPYRFRIEPRGRMRVPPKAFRFGQAPLSVVVDEVDYVRRSSRLLTEWVPTDCRLPRLGRRRQALPPGRVLVPLASLYGGPGARGCRG